MREPDPQSRLKIGQVVEQYNKILKSRWWWQLRARVALKEEARPEVRISRGRRWFFNTVGHILTFKSALPRPRKWHARWSTIVTEGLILLALIWPSLTHFPWIHPPLALFYWSRFDYSCSQWCLLTILATYKLQIYFYTASLAALEGTRHWSRILDFSNKRYLWCCLYDWWGLSGYSASARTTFVFFEGLMPQRITSLIMTATASWFCLMVATHFEW